MKEIRYSRYWARPPQIPRLGCQNSEKSEGKAKDRFIQVHGFNWINGKLYLNYFLSIQVRQSFKVAEIWKPFSRCSKKVQKKLILKMRMKDESQTRTIHTLRINLASASTLIYVIANNWLSKALTDKCRTCKYPWNKENWLSFQSSLQNVFLWLDYSLKLIDLV